MVSSVQFRLWLTTSWVPAASPAAALRTEPLSGLRSMGATHADWNQYANTKTNTKTSSPQDLSHPACSSLLSTHWFIQREGLNSGRLRCWNFNFSITVCESINSKHRMACQFSLENVTLKFSLENFNFTNAWILVGDCTFKLMFVKPLWNFDFAQNFYAAVFAALPNF